MNILDFFFKEEFKSLLLKCFALFSRADKKRLILVSILQLFLAFLDLAGVAAVGILGALGVKGIQSQPPGDRVSVFLRTLGMEDLSLQNQVGIIGIFAAFILISRSIFSIIITRRILYFLSRRSAVISSNLITQLMNQNLLQIRSRSSQETLFAVTTGVNTIILSVIGSLVTLVSDFSILIIICIGLFAVDPILAGLTFFLFSSIVVVLYLLIHKRAQYLGHLGSVFDIQNNEMILEALSSYREIYIRNRRKYYSNRISEIRFKLSNIRAELSFIPNISKYVVELTLVIGAIAICALQFLINDASRAVAILTIFLASSSRLAPAILRLQYSAITIKSGLAISKRTLDLMESFKIEISKSIDDNYDELDILHDGFEPSVELHGVSFKYPGNNDFTVDNFSLRITPGSFVAFVGSSGAGKTTIVDILLGIIEPTTGIVNVSGIPVVDAIKNWPGAIAYVPQDVVILNSNFRENVSMGFPTRTIDENLVWNSLRIAQLMEFIDTNNIDLDSPVGENGTNLSGGQRQRLGIARAMFTNPKLIVFDEATSSLDGQTEFQMTKAILELKGTATVIMVAHRLASIRNADLVVYLKEGKIVYSGSFENVRKNVPEFDAQAKLMGL